MKKILLLIFLVLAAATTNAQILPFLKQNGIAKTQAAFSFTSVINSSPAYRYHSCIKYLHSGGEPFSNLIN